MAIDPLKAAIEAEVSSNPLIQSRVQRFINLALDEAEKLMQTGTPQIQASLIRSVVPAMVKIASTLEEKDDKYEAVRDELKTLQNQFQSGVFQIDRSGGDTEDEDENRDENGDGEVKSEGAGNTVDGIPKDLPPMPTLRRIQ